MTDMDHERAKLRREHLLHTLYTAWPNPLGSGLLAADLPEDLKCSGDCLDRGLAYLEGRGLLTREPRANGSSVQLHALTATGVDHVESGAEFDTARRRGLRMLRLRVLQALDWGRPQPLGRRLISRALSQDTDLDLTDPSLRRALAYLTAVGAAESGDGQGELYKITPDGIDYLDGDGDGIEGVARPVEW
jgi:hypothetical protein